MISCTLRVSALTTEGKYEGSRSTWKQTLLRIRRLTGKSNPLISFKWCEVLNSFIFQGAEAEELTKFINYIFIIIRDSGIFIMLKVDNNFPSLLFLQFMLSINVSSSKANQRNNSSLNCSISIFIISFDSTQKCILMNRPRYSNNILIVLERSFPVITKARIPT